MLPYTLIRPLLFALDAECAHELTLQTLAVTSSLGLGNPPPVSAKPVSVMGLEFPNRVGLAAGLDKNGVAIDGLAGLGFGFHRGRHGHATSTTGQPEAAPVPPAGAGSHHQSHGLQQRRYRCAAAAPAGATLSGHPWHQYRQELRYTDRAGG
jgi:hypothetical protein